MKQGDEVEVRRWTLRRLREEMDTLESWVRHAERYLPNKFGTAGRHDMRRVELLLQELEQEAGLKEKP